MYDYLVVGSGLYGAVLTHEALKKGKSVLVIDKRSHIAGNVYTERMEGINVHKYGAHIFHTSGKKFGNMYSNLLNLTTISTVQLPITKVRSTIFLLI